MSVNQTPNVDVVTQLTQLEEEIEAAKLDATKWQEKNNKAAGTRVRGKMQSIKTLAQSIRVGIQHRNNQMS